MGKTKQKIYKVILVVFLIFPFYAKAEILFQDNFNLHADWTPVPPGMENDDFPGGTAGFDFNSSSDNYNTPVGWSYFRSTGIWWGPMYEETIQINNRTSHGNGQEDGIGKSLMIFNEAHIGSSGDGWGADGIISKLLPEDQQEIYARVWLRTQAGWKWNSNDDMMIKMFRIKHFDRNGSIYLNFPGGNNAPVYLWDFKHSNSWGTRWVNTLLCDPQATNYNCSNAGVNGDQLFVSGDMNVEPNAPGILADGKWHRLDFHVKMNTYEPFNPGCIDNGLNGWCSNGIYEFSYDGIKRESHQNVAWKRSGSYENVGWNAIDLGGNAFNNYNNLWIKNHTYNVDDTTVFNSYNWKALQTHLSADANRPGFSSTTYWQNMGLIVGQKEQWYAMDDLVVSTTQIPENYVIGNLDTTAPSMPNNLSVL